MLINKNFFYLSISDGLSELPTALRCFLMLFKSWL